MRNIRIKFSKTGNAKYISHLDLNRFFQRTFKKAGVPAWYTEGFNPHIYLHFLLPLSLGTESECEFLDLKLTDDSAALSDVKNSLNSVLPEGFSVKEVYEYETKPAEIHYCRYEITFEEAEKSDVERFWARDEIPVLKKTKRKEYTVDLKKEALSVKISEKDGHGFMSLVLPATENNSVNPELLVTAFGDFTGEESFCRILRTGVLMMDGTAFK